MLGYQQRKGISKNNWVAAGGLTLLWFGSRALDFSTGFVDFSLFRLFLMVVIYIAAAALFFTIVSGIQGRIYTVTQRFAEAVCRSVPLLVVFTIVLALLGFLIFFTRYQRGAHMGETPDFQNIIFSTANFEGVFLLSPGVTQFSYHNNLFLVVFVPLVWVFGQHLGWYIIQLFHSAAIATTTTITGLNARTHFASSIFGLVMAVSFFLATYKQHMKFIDTHFAALAMGVFIFGVLQDRKKIVVLGFLLVMITRETTLLTATMMVIFARRVHIPNKLKLIFVVIGVLWIAGTFMIMSMLGGAESPVRFPDCLMEPHLSLEYVNCTTGAILEDTPLKLAYTVRILSFAPMIVTSWFGMSGLSIEFLQAWLSHDYVLYNLSWHHYLVPVTIVVMVGSSQAVRLVRLKPVLVMLMLWTVSTCIWQFFTTVNLILF